VNNIELIVLIFAATTQRYLTKMLPYPAMIPIRRGAIRAEKQPSFFDMNIFNSAINHYSFTTIGWGD
jgi:hypothetical protein